MRSAGTIIGIVAIVVLLVLLVGGAGMMGSAVLVWGRA